MRLLVNREISTRHSFSGTLFIDGERQCYTLEPPLVPFVNADHPDGLSCVPFGTYELHLRQDGSVWAWMKKSCPGIGLENGIPWIYNIEGNQYDKWHIQRGIQPEQFVLIHVGNFETPDQFDSLGCLLLGMTRSTDYVGQSILAFNNFYPKLLAAMNAGEYVTIEYADGRTK